MEMDNSGMVTKANWRIYLLCAGLLIANCLWRVFVPAHEYPPSFYTCLTLLLDAGLLFGLVGLYLQFSKQMAAEDGRLRWLRLLFWPAMLAGIVIFVIRFSGSDGWATGHWHYSLG
jgi:hypothetical protein